ncbi:MAG: hypothetical protein WC768_01320 [Patescibacteria group bacterium]
MDSELLRIRIKRVACPWCEVESALEIEIPSLVKEVGGNATLYLVCDSCRKEFRLSCQLLFSLMAYDEGQQCYVIDWVMADKKEEVKQGVGWKSPVARLARDVLNESWESQCLRRLKIRQLVCPHCQAESEAENDLPPESYVAAMGGDVLMALLCPSCGELIQVSYQEIAAAMAYASIDEVYVIGRFEASKFDPVATDQIQEDARHGIDRMSPAVTTVLGRLIDSVARRQQGRRTIPTEVICPECDFSQLLRMKPSFSIQEDMIILVSFLCERCGKPILLITQPARCKTFLAVTLDFDKLGADLPPDEQFRYVFAKAREHPSYAETFYGSKAIWFDCIGRQLELLTGGSAGQQKDSPISRAEVERFGQELDQLFGPDAPEA